MKLLRSFAIVAGGLLCALAVRAQSQSYTFSSIAGLSGTPGATDGTNSAARFGQPYGVAVDSTGNVYVVDALVNRIRRITPVGTNWVATTLAGSAYGNADGTNRDALFASPEGIAVDNRGNLFVADTGNQRVRKVTPVGTNWVVSTVYNQSQPARFLNPAGIAVDNSGTLYVADYDSLWKVVPSGTSWVASKLPYSFQYAYGVAVDSAGNLYVPESNRYIVRKLTPAGSSWTISTLAGTSGTRGLVDGTNNAARFYFPEAVALDQTGNLYVADYNRIRKLTPVGTNWVVTTIGKQTTQFFGIAVDSLGNLFVPDTGASLVNFGQIIPSVRLSIAANRAVLSWPRSAYNFVLETSTSASPNASWLPLTNGVISSETAFSLTNNLSGPAAFYRLRK